MAKFYTGQGDDGTTGLLGEGRVDKFDLRMEAMGADMPFDGMRMIFAGFDSMIDDRAAGTMGYVDGYLVPVPDGNKDAYRAMAAKASEVFRDHGATRVVEAWGDDVPDGKVTDYHRAAPHIDVRKALILAQQRARKRHQRVRNG